MGEFEISDDGDGASERPTRTARNICVLSLKMFIVKGNKIR